jgi:Dna[CI] antecedent, DciA
MKKPTAVSHLLEQGEGMLERLRKGTANADRALAALRRVLPPEIAREVWSASQRGTTLTAFVHTAAWGTRLRYVIPGLKDALEAELGGPVDEVKVKVRAMPGRGRSPSAKGQR